MKQANKVFGYTRLMVATFGLGGGMAALERTVKYARERVQFGTAPWLKSRDIPTSFWFPTPCSWRRPGPISKRWPGGWTPMKKDLQVEGSIAKYFATEAGDAMANDAIQAFGGYGYIREYEVEKIKRDVKILTIYEGTSEIQRNIISMFRLRSTVRSKGGFYNEIADHLARLPSETGGPMLADGVRVMNEVIQGARKGKLTKSQYIMFQLAT